MSEMHLYLGWRTAILGLVAVQILVLACGVVTSATNRLANRFLGLALLVIAGLLGPYALGFAGAYDVWRGLTFVPIAIPLALGPLLYAYARALEGGRLSRRMVWHSTAPAVQAAYYACCFLLPIGPKWAWYTGGHRAVVAPVFSLLTLVSLGVYGWKIGGVLKRYRARLADQRSDDDRFSARWLSRVQISILFGLLVETGFWLWSIVTGGIDYFQETGLYFALGALGLYLGVAGWRHSGLPALAPSEDLLPEDLLPEDLRVAEPARKTIDWVTVAAGFADRTRKEDWWREPDLTLPQLARQLGTNTGRLSRAINLGLGVNFSVFINGLRAEGVADVLARHPDTELLDLAFEMGFASKASFNRAFRARYGMAPSLYRRQVSNSDSSPLDGDLRRAKA